MQKCTRILSLSRYRLFSTGTRTIGSGHNKWSKIKDKKGIADASKSTLFTKVFKDILVAARSGGSPNPDLNISLAAILKRAKEAGVPKENIARALEKASKGKADGETLTYEAIAFREGGWINYVYNATRTIQFVKDILGKHGAHMTPVGFMFNRKGFVKLSVPEEDLETIAIDALDHGAEDFETFDTEVKGTKDLGLICDPSALNALAKTLSQSGTIQSSELIYKPTDPVEPAGETLEQVENLVEALEGLEDTLRVWTNVNHSSSSP